MSCDEVTRPLQWYGDTPVCATQFLRQLQLKPSTAPAAHPAPHNTSPPHPREETPQHSMSPPRPKNQPPFLSRFHSLPFCRYSRGGLKPSKRVTLACRLDSLSLSTRNEGLTIDRRQVGSIIIVIIVIAWPEQANAIACPWDAAH
ncbi:hypothetical protein SKAU_G00114250 [Synaphobranchus kaupii]|uniref:Uncharacterized protein n=1 Tax=Synaphobranchus kaupii TaxID=118154 RepID=A0A9Q1G1B1_SYNKA|nr:hypothetical protein SKAU_G00114250 [Synaphobranchus kaupii]